MTIADWDVMENIDNIPAISFACLVVANLHYGLFGELVEDSPLFLSSDKLEDCAVGTYYRWHGGLMASSCITYNGIILEDAFDSNDEDDKGAEDDDDGEKDDKGVVDDGDGEEEDNDQGEGDDGGVGDSDGRVEEEDNWEEDNDKESDEHHSGSGHLGTPGKLSLLNTLDKLSSLDIPGKPSSLDTPGKPSSLDTPGKLLDTTKDVVVFSDEGKIPRLIATLASILIAIVVDTTMRFGTSVLGNPTPGITSAIPSVIEPFTMGNNAADLADVLSNFFSDCSQDASPTDPAAPTDDFFAPFPTAFFDLSLQSSVYQGDLTYVR